MWFCDECLSEAPRVGSPFCPRCGSELLSESSATGLCVRCRSTPFQVERIRSAVYSEGAVREALHAFKYDGVTALAAPLASLMVDYWSRHPMSVDVMVPVPLHKHRLRRRGFNQAALLARELAKHVHLALDEGSLVRHRSTAAQVDLDADERKANVRDAFRCIGDGIAGRDVLLVDDVCTTGSTLEACATALREGGARSVQALTLARARWSRI
jgi:ComF family protein